MNEKSAMKSLKIIVDCNNVESKVEADFQQVEPTKFLKTITDPQSVNHIVVFMTGTEPLPEGYGATVYLSLPTLNPGSWQYLGYICNQKPSAIFKITKHHPEAEGGQSHAFSTQAHLASVAQIGLSIEPLAQIQFQNSCQQSNHLNQDSYSEFCMKMLENFFNYASSFSVAPAQITNPSETYVPLKSLGEWFNNFKRRFEQNPNFWRQGSA